MNKNLTYFASDFHLGASYIKDPRQHETMIVDWLKSIEKKCQRLYLVGDILDYWYEYKTVVPRGFVRFFGQLASMSDSGTEIIWFIGNHDIWIFDYLPNELGIKIVDGSLIENIEGKTFYITHGDGIGKLPGGFRFIRGMFRNRFLQKLYAGIHPGLTIPFAHGWSSRSRKGNNASESEYTAPEGMESAVKWGREYAAEHPEINYIIIGHHHSELDETFRDGCRMIILGDWISKFSYAVFDGMELRLEKYNYICNRQNPL